jgi:hypothetical protein
VKLFKCQHCAQVLYFENVRCERCGHALGYIPEQAVLSALDPAGDLWQPLAKTAGQFRYCANAQHDACNWLVPAESDAAFCTACRFNRTVPDLGVAENLPPWRKLEIAKRRLFYTLLRLGLPLQDRTADPEHGLAFDFLADVPEATGPKVLTGHDNGLITVALAEADDAERERRRVQMREPYRTLLGHFRHEVGHYFWDVLVRDGGWLDDCRALFGDDSEDYGAALQRHYEQGAPPDWQDRFVSAYASTHPWEDFAETWAHYLHIVDTLEMANAFGVSVNPKVDTNDELTTEVDFDPHAAGDFQRVVDAWLPLSFAMNSLNRCMGAPDLYPFVLSPPVIEKLGFIHRIVHERRA